MDNSQKSERTRLLEVASRAGVSASTVSLVLTNKAEKRRISVETREKVKQAADDLNYAPNLLTRSLRRGRTHVLSLFSTFRHRDFGDLYMDRVSSAVEAAGGQYGYDVLIHCNFNRSPKEISQFLNGGLTDGLLMFAPHANDPLLALMRKTSLPVVIVGRSDPEGQYSSAADDPAEGIRLVVDHLLAAGHTSIAALGAMHSEARDSDTRLALLGTELASRGVELPVGRSIRVENELVGVIKDLMSQKDRPTAIFCWQDWLAYKALEACDELGIKVPNQLSIVSYDGVHWPSTSRHIVTSVEVDLRQIFLSAVQLLDQAIVSPQMPPVHLCAPVRMGAGTTLARVGEPGG